MTGPKRIKVYFGAHTEARQKGGRPEWQFEFVVGGDIPIKKAMMLLRGIKDFIRRTTWELTDG